MKIAMQSKNKISIIDGSYPKTRADSLYLAYSGRCNAIFLAYVMDSVAKDLPPGIVYSTSTKQIWEEFKGRLEKSNGSIIYALLRESQLSK